MAIDIGRCRWELHQRILFVAHPRQPGLFDAISALVEFERLDALAQQTDCYCAEWMIPLVPFRCPKHVAEAALAEIVTAVLSP